MGFVAEIASTGDLSLVRSMALGAGRERPVDIMAAGAVKGRMFALIFPEHPALHSMACQAGLCARSLE